MPNLFKAEGIKVRVIKFEHAFSSKKSTHAISLCNGLLFAHIFCVSSFSIEIIFSLSLTAIAILPADHLAHLFYLTGFIICVQYFFACSILETGNQFLSLPYVGRQHFFFTGSTYFGKCFLFYYRSLFCKLGIPHTRHSTSPAVEWSTTGRRIICLAHRFNGQYACCRFSCNKIRKPYCYAHRRDSIFWFALPVRNRWYHMAIDHDTFFLWHEWQHDEYLY